MAKQIALKIYVLLSMLKTVALAIFMETEIFYNIFVTFDQFNASLPSKHI